MYNCGGRIQKRGGAQSRLGHCYILVNNNNKTNQTTVLLGYETRLHHFIDSLCYPYSDFFFFPFFYLLLIWWSEYRLIDCNSTVWFDKSNVTTWQIRLQSIWFGNLARGTSLDVHFTCNEVLSICIRVNIWVWMTVGMKMNDSEEYSGFSSVFSFNEIYILPQATNPLCVVHQGSIEADLLFITW